MTLLCSSTLFSSCGPQNFCLQPNNAKDNAGRRSKDGQTDGERMKTDDVFGESDNP